MHLFFFLIIAIWCGAQAKSSCYPNPCQNGETCKLIKGQIDCACPDYVEGAFCEKSICIPNPCMNGGECIVIDRENFHCKCPEGYNGSICETNNRCDSNHCENGGTCTKIDGKSSCSCPANVYGESCETSSCNPNPCKNGGECTPIGRLDFTCKCPEGYVGEKCEIRIKNSTGYMTRVTEFDRSSTTTVLSSANAINNQTITDSSSVSTSESYTENNYQSTTLNFSSTDASTKYETGKTGSERRPATMNTVSLTINESSAVDNTNTRYTFSTGNSIETSSDSGMSTIPSISDSTQKDTRTVTDILNITLTSTTGTTTLTTTVSSTPVGIDSSTTSYFTKINDNLTTENIVTPTVVYITQVNNTDMTTIIKSTKPFTNHRISSISMPLSSKSITEITTPSLESTTKTSEQPAIDVTNYSKTGDEFNTPANISDDPGRELSTTSRTVDIKVISEETTDAEVNTEALNTTTDGNFKDVNNSTESQQTESDRPITTTILPTSSATNDQTTTDPSTFPTSDGNTENNYQSTTLDFSSTDASTEYEIIKTKSERPPTITNTVSVAIKESSATDNTNTTYNFSTGNSIETSSESGKSTIPSTSDSTQDDNRTFTDFFNTTLTPATDTTTLITTVFSTLVETNLSTTSYFPKINDNLTTKNTEISTVVPVTEENNTNMTTIIKSTKSSANPRISSISMPLSSKSIKEITTPSSESTTKTSEQSASGVTEYTITEDEFKTSGNISDDPSGRNLSTTSSTMDIKVISGETTDAEFTTETLNSTIDGNFKDDSVKDQVSSNARLSYSDGLAVGGGLLAVICLASSGWYIARKYRRRIFWKSEDYDANSIVSESSNTSQNNHLV